MRFIVSTLICLTAIFLFIYQNQIVLFTSQPLRKTHLTKENNKTLYSIIDTVKTIVNTYFVPKEKKTQLSMSAAQVQRAASSIESDFHGIPLIPENDPSLTADENMSISRAIRKVFLASAKSEGVGARVRRSIGVPELRNFTPFLMLDHFTVPPSSGFPDHPHRHFETVTYLLQGGIEHEDFAGHRGVLEPGDLQFMTAGRGIVHAEMPIVSKDGSPNVGMQLWVDLPEKLKWCEPRYRDLKAKEIPIDTSEENKYSIKVIAGQTKNGVVSVQNLSYTPVWFLDVTVHPGGKLVQPLPRGWNAFAYMMDGSALIGEDDVRKHVEKYHMTVFEQKGDKVVVTVPETATESARFILVAGLPLDQPIFQMGPFVSTSRSGIYQALLDYQNSSNGFERAKEWESEIGKRMAH